MSEAAPLSALSGFGLKIQPMVHVEAMGPALDFYRALGARLVFGSRDGDWSLLAMGDSTLALLAHPPGDGRMETVELQFTCAVPLERIEAHLRATDDAWIERGVADEAFGRMLKVLSPDGLPIKILELERELIT